MSLIKRNSGKLLNHFCLIKEISLLEDGEIISDESNLAN